MKIKRVESQKNQVDEKIFTSSFRLLQQGVLYEVKQNRRLTEHRNPVIKESSSSL